MTAEPDRTVWLPKDLPLAIFLSIAIWGIGGLGWGLVMWITVGDWLLAGLIWGAFCWRFMSIYLLIACRELSTTIQAEQPGVGQRQQIDMLTQVQIDCLPVRIKIACRGRSNRRTD